MPPRNFPRTSSKSMRSPARRSRSSSTSSYASADSRASSASTVDFTDELKHSRESAWNSPAGRAIRSEALYTDVADLVGRTVDYNLSDKNMGVNVDGLQESRSWDIRRADMEKHQKILNEQMNPHLINICYETHLKNNLFRYTKKPHPCSWVYHADTNMHTFISSAKNDETFDLSRPGTGVEGEGNPETVISSNIPIVLNEATANSSVNKIVLEVSTVDPDFSIAEFKKCTGSTPYLAGVYDSSIDCKACDIPGINAKKGRCRVMLAEHLDTRLTDIDPKKIHPQDMLNLFAHVLYAVDVLHTYGYVHGGMCLDAVGVNYIAYNKIHTKNKDEPIPAFPDHKSWQDQFVVFTSPAEDKNKNKNKNNSYLPESCNEHSELYFMPNILFAGTDKKGKGGIQLVLGGYNHIRKIKSSYCTTSDDVASVILMFAKKFGSNFVHHFSRMVKPPAELAEADGTSGSMTARNEHLLTHETWTGAPLLQHIGSRKDLLDITTEQISLAAFNTPDGKNNEERIEHLQKRYSWARMFTCAREALIKCCGPVFFKYDYSGLSMIVNRNNRKLSEVLQQAVKEYFGDPKRQKKLLNCNPWESTPNRGVAGTVPPPQIQEIIECFANISLLSPIETGQLHYPICP